MIDPASFGQVVLLSTTITILTTIGSFGQHRTILHYTAADAHQSYGALIVAFIYAAVLVSLGLLVLIWLQDSIPTAILFVSLLMVLHALISTQRRAFGDIKCFTLLRSSVSISRFILVVGALAIFEDMRAYIAAEILAIVVSLIMASRNVHKIFTESKDVSARRFSKSGAIGAPLLLHAILFMCITHYDKLLLASFGQYDQLGQYGFLYMIVASVAFVSAFVGIKYEPLIYQSASETDAFSTAYHYQNRLLFAQGIMAVTMIFVWQIVKPVIMPEITLGWLILPILFIGQILSQSALPWSVFLTRTMSYKAQTVCIAIAAAASISFNTILIPKYGPTGAAITFLASNTIYFLFVKYAAQLQIKERVR